MSGKYQTFYSKIFPLSKNFSLEFFIHQLHVTVTGSSFYWEFKLTSVIQFTLKNKKPKVHGTSGLVPKAGIEPARPKAHDFESCASTNSATQAFFLDWAANMCNL